MAPLYVPVALIRRLCYPSTYRLDKLEYIQFPTPKLALPAPTNERLVANALATRHINHANGAPGSRTILGTRDIVDAMRQHSQPMPISGNKVGNMPNEEYRFWAGRKDPEWDDCICRFCEAHVRGGEGRKGHHTNSQCRENLGIVYKMLRREKTCVVCDAATPFQKWGLPLCDTACQTEWRLTIPGALRFAVRRFNGSLKGEPGNA